MGLVSALLFALATTKAAPARLRIDVVFEGRTMSRARTDSAAREVRAIWARYGVDVRVVGAASDARADAITLHVTLAEHGDPRLSREALGSINFHDGMRSCQASTPTPVRPRLRHPMPSARSRCAIA